MSTETMPEYQQRVIQERDTLVSKKTALDGFVSSETFANVEETERRRMLRQQTVMGEYIEILNERINNFTNE